MLEMLTNKPGIERDVITAATYKRYPIMSARDESMALKSLWRKESKKTGALDDGCGHGLIRFPYDSEFTPCHCGIPIIK